MNTKAELQWHKDIIRHLEEEINQVKLILEIVLDKMNEKDLVIVLKGL